MEKRRIGSLEVTVVGIGCNNFGRELDAVSTKAVIDAALDAGITFFDTADSYGKPKTASESLVGQCLRGRRDEVVIATKFGRVLDEERRGASPQYVRAAMEASLRRLQTDHIDLMQLHIPDPDTPIEDTLGALQDLIGEGKIREIGASNFTAEQLRSAGDAAAANRLRPFASTQDEYSLLRRDREADLMVECARQGVGFVPFRPLFNGLLTGKYRPGSPAPTGTRIGSKSAQAQSEIFSESNMEAVARLLAFAEARGRGLLDLAFAWLLAHESVPSVIAGVSSPSQVRSNAAAAEWRLTPEELAEVDALVPGPEVSVVH